MSQPSLSLDIALQFCQAWSLPICYTDTGVELWAPNTRGINVRVRRSVRKHEATIAAMMAAANIKVCPSPKLHKRSWIGRVCTACRRLDASMSRTHQDKIMT